ncbi:hypothetical protein HK101_003493 [Irineochytrium annulatum]|nr:hypothetical protein HK101_003493 [Irineochytrium annulatum]
MPVLWHVIVNPYAGAKQGLASWIKLKTALHGAKWRFNREQSEDPEAVDEGSEQPVGTENAFRVLFTTSAGHAKSSTVGSSLSLTHHTSRELASQIIEKDGVSPEVCFIAIGGDGIVHEIVNGVMSAVAKTKRRPSVRLGIIPAGTGNALATSAQLDTVEDAIERILSGNCKPMKINSVSISPLSTGVDDSLPVSSWPKEILAYSFCVVSWGLHAQIVKQSETLRMLGNSRFKYAAMLNIVFQHQYAGRLYYAQNSISDAQFGDVSKLALYGKGAPRFSYFLTTKVGRIVDDSR